MIIKHYCNSFISITCGNTKVICDPWVGQAGGITWLSYPFKENGHKLVEQENPDYIYISHIHSDHLAPDVLKHVDKNITFIIKHFENQQLFKRINNLGFKNVIEITPWEPFTLNDDIDIAIVTATNLVNNDLESNFEYELDTSIHIHDKNTNRVFFNNVDTPNNLADLKRNKEFSIEHWGRPIDIACLPVGAASQYPQCFINIDRKVCQQELIQRCLDQLPGRVDAIGASNIFIAGGTYVICGKFAPLNRMIAQPSFTQIQEKLHEWEKADNNVCHIEGGGILMYNDQDNCWNQIDDGNRILPDKQEYIKESRTLPYNYSSKIRDAKINDRSILEELNNLFNAAKDNYYKRLDQYNIDIKWHTTIKIYRDLQVDNNGDMIPAEPMAKYYLTPEIDEINLDMVIHIDADLFYETLTKKYVWSGVLAASLSLLERSPNVFIPDAEFTLNFLTS